MGGSTDMPAYSHTQTAPLCLVLYGIAIVAIVLAAVMDEWLGSISVAAVGLILVLVAAAFRHLTVEDEGDVLAIRFGPLPLFHKRVWYADIRQVEVGRSLILDCWGMPCTIRGGWVWNLWGRDCVVVQRKDNSILRMGTDDAENPAGFPW